MMLFYATSARDLFVFAFGTGMALVLLDRFGVFESVFFHNNAFSPL